MPDRPVTVIVNDIESQTIHPFVLEQPAPDNGFTLKLFLSDRGRGYSWWEFELYYADRPPEELGLAVPWQNPER